MKVTATTKSFHPGHWQPATWSLLAVWLTASALGNWPFQPMGIGGSESTIVHIGLPLWYCEHEYDPSSGLTLTTTDGSRLFVNVILGIAVHLSLILTVQRFQQFSIGTMLLVVFLVGLLLTIGKSLDGLYSVYLVIGIYLLPLPLAAMVIANLCAARIPNATRRSEARETPAVSAMNSSLTPRSP